MLTTIYVTTSAVGTTTGIWIEDGKVEGVA